MWPTILIGALVGAVLHVGIYAVTKSMKGEAFTWKGALAAAVGGAIGGAIAGSGVGLLAAGGARALTFVAANGAVTAGTETVTRNALEGEPLMKDVVRDAVVGAATAPILYGTMRSASGLLPEVTGALQGKVPVATVIEDVKDALVKVRASDAAKLLGGGATATTAALSATSTATTDGVVASGRASAVALARGRIARVLADGARRAVPALRDPANHLISASSLSDAVTPSIVLAGDALDPDARSRRRGERTRDDLPLPRTMDAGLPLPRTPERRSSAGASAVRIDVGASGGTTVSLASNAPAGTTITVGPDGRTVTVRVGTAGAAGVGPAAPGPRSTGLVGALAGEQRTVGR